MASHLNQNHSQRSAKVLEASKAKHYTSPQRKLVRFFEKSRDQWKAKCLDAKASVKRLHNRMRCLEKSTERWKHRVTELEADLTKLKAQVRAREEELET